MKQKKILFIAGARPNFMKLFPLLVAGKKKLQQVWVHTGQHYDKEMSELILRQFQLPKPKYHLNVGSGTHAVQTALVLKRLDKILDKEKPDCVGVVGDVNSTLASALAATKKGIPVAHVEAGLRSFDRTMPEEINRLLTDQIADFLFIPSKEARKNLIREGVSQKKIYFVGNIMIDTLRLTRPQWEPLKFWNRFGLKKGGYFLLTLHRPNNVDHKAGLSHFLKILDKTQQKIPVLFPAHPRTQMALKRFGLLKQLKKMKQLHFMNPIGYFETINLMSGACGVLTDSGGMQEESTYLKIPCLTLRSSTERPVTVSHGTNVVVGMNEKRILAEIDLILSRKRNRSQIPPLWDGKTASRIISILMKARF